MKKNLIAISFLLSFGLSLPSALEIKSGIIKAVIDESNARVSIYKLVDVAKGRYEPLLFDIDPRTSYLTLSFAGKQSKLGDTADYRFMVNRTETGARLEFRSAFCLMTEDLDFVTSSGSALADGIKLTFTVTNLSQKDADIGLRFLIDTWLGEKSGNHFKTDLQAKVNGEGAISGSVGDSWVESPGDKASLMVMLKGSAFPGPDKTIFANWKRLNDEPWAFDPVVGRSFTLLPYSVNDSALALYWQPLSVAKGATRKMATILGVYSDKGFPSEASVGSASALYAQTMSGSPSSDPAAAMAQDLLSVRDLIARIDQAISSGKALSADEIATWMKILDRLEERKKGY